MKPVTRIVITQGGSTLYTLNNIALNIHTHHAITDAISTFSVTLPVRIGGTWKYYDINPYDEIAIYFGATTIPATPDLIGKIVEIDGDSNDNGRTRTLTGLGLGEILARRVPSYLGYNSLSAHTIADNIADELSLGKDTDADANTINLLGQRESYHDLYRKLSDFWVNAGNQVKKDFYVNDVAGTDTLFWKTRPIRTAGVETLTVGSNILAYKVHRTIQNVKNNITVSGRFDKTNSLSLMPNDENWTEPDVACTNWTASLGSLSQEAAIVNEGTYSLQCDTVGNPPPNVNTALFYRNLKPEFGYISRQRLTTDNSFGKLQFYVYLSDAVAPNTRTVQLWAPDGSNYYHDPITTSGPAWQINTFDLDSTITNEVGSPDPNDITAVAFHFEWLSAGTRNCYIDSLFFIGGRYYKKVSDATSIAAYEQRDLYLVEDSLLDTSACEQRAQTYLYQLKDQIVRIDVVTRGNSNILVGDRLSMTIPQENISATNFDVISVDHYLNSDTGWTTKTIMMNSANVRTINNAPISRDEMVKSRWASQSAIGKHVGLQPV